MDKSDENTDVAAHFEMLFSEYSDNEILEVLRKHKDFQDRAVTVAVKIAIDRKLIHSEQDLMSPEFQYSKLEKFTIFPEITNVYHQERLISSIFRYLYVLSLLPIIYGVLKYAEGSSDHTILGLFTGVTWFTFCVMLNRTRKQIFFFFLFVLLLLVSVSVGNQILTADHLLTLDFVMLLIVLFLSAYMLLYLRKLIQVK
jgi:hypothetical protein